jgi:hypothetical protein
MTNKKSFSRSTQKFLVQNKQGYSVLFQNSRASTYHGCPQKMKQEFRSRLFQPAFLIILCNLWNNIFVFVPEIEHIAENQNMSGITGLPSLKKQQFFSHV